jgi:general L-amino acid transport system substrate-binding protein
MIRRSRTRNVVGALVAFTLIAAACSDDSDDDVAAPAQEDEEAPETEGTLAEVQDRGELICGVNDVVPGFGLETEGEFDGFDIDYCRVLAAAVLGDADAVQFVPLTAEQRLTALQAGEIDVLIRNTTWTATRDGAEGLTFLTTTFYDGQGMMVNADAGFDSIDDLDGATICVLSGTTTELNLATRFATMDYTPRTFADNEDIRPEFEAGACQGWTSDLSQLAGIRSTWPDELGGPDALVIFDEAFSKEPLGPVVRDGDSEWAQVVDWAVIATIQAEEFDLTSDNLDQRREEALADEDIAVLRFLGEAVAEEEDEDPAIFDPGLGLETDFAVDIIEQVGNYGEIYERHVGPDTPLGLERGVNDLWTEGGLLYAPPYV